MVSVSDDFLEDDVPKRLEVELRSINAPAILIDRDQQRRIAADKTCRRVRLKVERPAAASHRIRKRSPCRRLVASCALGYIRDQDKHEPGLASQSLRKLPFQAGASVVLKEHCAGPRQKIGDGLLPAIIEPLGLQGENEIAAQ
jgi:hypothetical protein